MSERGVHLAGSPSPFVGSAVDDDVMGSPGLVMPDIFCPLEVVPNSEQTALQLAAASVEPGVDMSRPRAPSSPGYRP